ncbi:hypothetical protein WJX77_003577, partial [Trebouxia sp. C0004]
LQQPCWGYS